MRERSSVPKRAPIWIVVATPARVEIDVAEAMSFQARGAHRVRLRENILLIHHRAGGYDCFLAEGAPAKIRLLTDVIDLCMCACLQKNCGCDKPGYDIDYSR